MNLLYSNYLKGRYIAYVDGALAYYSTIDDNTYASYFADLKPNTTYTLTRITNTSRFRVATFFTDVKNSSGKIYTIGQWWLADSYNTITFTTGSDDTHLVVYYTWSSEYDAQIMLNEGSEAEPYEAPTQSFTYAPWTGVEGEYPSNGVSSAPSFSPPYPAAMWRIDGAHNNGYPWHELLRNVPYNPPPPPSPAIDPLEFYDEYNDEYLFALNQKHRRYKLRVELLGYYENVVGEITKDVSIDASGQITINNEQITRRSCSLNLINVEKQYLPSSDNPIWFNRKFKLWIGIVIKDKTYWWSQGVYFTQKATCDGNVVSIQGVDKGGALDGTIKTGMLDTTYIIESGTTIANVIRDTLMWNETNSPYLKRNTRATSYPIDPITPIIDSRFNTYHTQNEITLNGNDYISTLFSSLADGYGADAYYNTNGRFIFQQMADDNRIDGYRFMARQWNFEADGEFYADSNVEYNFDSYNVVTVYTNESDLVNVSYTAANNNPLSPLRLDSAGVRRMSDVEIPYVNVSQDEMEQRCKAYADYLLMKEAMRGMSISFSSPIIPHLDVNRTIGITDKRFDLDDETFVVNSITIPLSAESMQINATRFSWLPDNTTIEG